MEEHPTSEDFARFLQQSSRPGRAERNALVVRHLLSGCAVCSRVLQEIQGADEHLSRLLDIPQQEPTTEVHSSYNYDWAFSRVERSFASMLKDGALPPERQPDSLAELAGLSKGEQIRRVGVEDRFAQPEFILRLIERSHNARYQSPRKMLHLAYMSHLATEACTPRAAGGEPQLADLRTRAWGQYGTALRVSSRPGEAKRALAVALRYWDAGTGDLRLRAWLLERTTALSTFQNQFKDAIGMCEEAGAIYRDLGESHLFAGTLIQKAIAALYSGEAESAINILTQATPLIDSEEDPYLLFAAQHNLTRCYIDFDQPEEALALHCETRPLYQECKDPLLLLRATWQEGILLREIGHLHNATAALIRARQGFAEQGLGYEVALVSLDLVEVYSKLGKSDELRQVIAEAMPIFRSLCLGPEVLASLLLLQQATDSQSSPQQAGQT